MKKGKFLIPVFSVFVFSMLLFVSAFAATDSKASINTSQLTVQQLKEYDAKIDSTFSKEINGQLSQYILETSLEDIPVYITDSSVPDSDVTAATLQNFVNGARKSAKDDFKLNKSTQSYEFIDIEEETTYIYHDSATEGTNIIVLASEETNDNTPKDFGAIDMVNAPGVSPLAGSSTNLSGGIGCMALTASSSSTPIGVKLVSGNINYAGSVADVGQDDLKKIGFYNYLGMKVSNDILGDLGISWSEKFQGWKPYFLLTQGSTTYSIGKNVTFTDGDAAYLYKATANYPTKLFVSKNYAYQSTNKVKLTIMGTRTNMVESTTSIVAGTGISSAAQYRILTTIANEADEGTNIKKGTSIDSTFSAVTINNNPVTSYSSLLYDNGTISSYYPDLVYKVKKQ